VVNKRDIILTTEALFHSPSRNAGHGITLMPSCRSTSFRYISYMRGIHVNYIRSGLKKK
jgi:hypothetical protein